MGDQQQFEAELAPEVGEFGSVVHAAIRDAGGFDLVMRAESEPKIRTREIEPLLDELGVFELDPADSETQLQAAATACRAAGAFAVPYPVAERLAASVVSGLADQSNPAAVGLVASVAPEPRVLLNMGDVDLAWHATDTTGRLRALNSTGAAYSGGRLGPFVAELAMSESEISVCPAAVPVVTHLQSCTLLGMLEGALELTATYAGQRHQFGAPIVAYQAIQHQLAHALTALELFERHVLYGLWSLASHRANVLVDVIGSRVVGLRAADVVLRVGHQVHGATGFCDESAISWISRHSLPLRRLPLNRPQTERWFTELTVDNGLDGLFPSRVPLAAAGSRSGRGGQCRE